MSCAKKERNTIATTKKDLTCIFFNIQTVQWSQPYHVKLEPNAVLYSLTKKKNRRIPRRLMWKVKEEPQRMEELNVITQVEEPTDW